MERKKPVRVTADLPEREFEHLDTARILNDAGTTDIVRALIRLQASDPALAERVAEEVAKLREEKVREKLSQRKGRRLTTRSNGTTQAAA